MFRLFGRARRHSDTTFKVKRSKVNLQGRRHIVAASRTACCTCERNKLCGRPPQYSSAPCKLTFDLLTLKVVSESRVTWATGTSVPILVFPAPLCSRLKARSHSARRRTSTSVRQRTTSSVVVRCRPLSSVVVRRRTANHMHRYVNDMQI